MNQQANPLPTSRSAVSEPDEVNYDESKLYIHEMYETNNIHLMEIVASQTVKKLIDNAVEIIYENYLQSKMGAHAIELTYDLMDLVTTTEFTFSDENTFTANVDEEIQTPVIDTWARTKIVSKKWEPKTDRIKAQIYITCLESVNTFTTTRNKENIENILSEGRRALQKAEENARKFIKEIDLETIPEPLEIGVKDEMSKSEDDIRQLKERERKRKEEEAALQKKIREQEQKERFFRREADLKNKIFTFDYTGNVMIVQPPKVEKLPSSNLQMHYSIQNPQAPAKKEKPKKEVKTVKSKLKKVPDAEKDFLARLALWGSAPNVFELFTPEKGVIFYEGARQKKGLPANASHSISLADGSFVSQDGGPVRLTKSEYYHLTKSGNLSRSISELSRSDEKQSPNGKWQIKVDGVKDLNFEQAKMLKKAGENRSALIKSINYSALNNLLGHSNSEESGYELIYQTQSVDLRSPKFTVEKGIPKSPVDVFNMEILNSRDWGKNIGSGINNNIPMLPKHLKKHTQLKTILGPLPKLPRDRALHSVNTMSHPSLKNPVKY